MSLAMSGNRMNQGTNANRSAAEHFWGQLDQGQPDRGDIRVLLDGYAGERLRLATFRHAPHVFTSDAVAHSYRQAALLSLQLEGDACIEQHGRCRSIAAGDFCLLDLSRPFRLEVGQSIVQIIYLPMAMLRGVVPQVERATAVVMPGHQSSVGYLRVLYEEIFTRAPYLTESVAGHLLDAVLPVLAAALEGNVSASTASPSHLRQHYKQLVRRFAREHLDDPGLSVETIGKGVGLSASYLFDLFADEDTTLMRWVRGERLARCRREFEDPAASRKSIAQVAYSWGFNDLAHFSRCFRQVFGVSPRGYRKQALFGASE